MNKTFRSNGKLLLTGEYVVLKGAVALALPTKFGQSLQVSPAKDEKITWTALDHQANPWFETQLKLSKGEVTTADAGKNIGEPEKALAQILSQAHRLNSSILNNGKGYNITTKLDFPNNWGLGSSSTLINNVAQWFEVDPYKLLEMTFKGSGYDIAAAQAEGPVTYQLRENSRSTLYADFDPSFKDRLFFVYLNKKQNSRFSIAHFEQQPKEQLQDAVEKISALTSSFLSCDNLAEFKLLMDIHETVISKLINLPKVKTELFPDFFGSIKSLGGWGGDFVLATGGEEEKNYFVKKGYGVIVPYTEMVL